MKELIFLTLANHLPRLDICDEYRYVLLRWAGLQIPEKCRIWGPLTIRPIGGAKNIAIGAGTFINTETRFGVPFDKVIIGKNVMVGPRVMFETVNHGLVHVEGKGRGGWTKPIIVEDEAWIGAGAIITQGVTVGRGGVDYLDRDMNAAQLRFAIQVRDRNHLAEVIRRLRRLNVVQGVRRQ